MEDLMYMMMLEKSKTYNKMTKQVVTEHVENESFFVPISRKYHFFRIDVIP